MQIKQWEDKNLAHFSYGIVSDCEKKMILVDPARDPQPYLDFAAQNGLTITGIIETHPHADFVSSHKEIAETTGATIYVNELVGVSYSNQPFNDGNSITVGKIKLTALHTPGHSPDSISILLEHEGKQKAVFTGDTLFIGDCGRPDLREGAGNIKAQRNELAKQMYHSLRDKLAVLDDDVLVYPAHGAGSLCGKALSSESSSTIGQEKATNWSMQTMSEEDFVKALLEDQPFIPAYFPYDVELNRTGAPALGQSLQTVQRSAAIKNADDANKLDQHIPVIDARNEKDYKQAHLPNSYNLMEGAKFETWLGSIIMPGESFYLATADEAQLERLLKRTAAIGYEPQVKEAFVLQYGPENDELLDVDQFKKHEDDYTIVDVRNQPEVRAGKPFAHSIAIPLADLRKKVKEIPTTKPIVVHCAGGYRSAAASSIIQAELQPGVPVYDLGESIKQFN